MAKRKSTRVKKIKKLPFIKKDRTLYISLVAMFAVLAGGIYVLTSKAAPEDPTLFNVTCSVDHYAADDPIVYPNMPGASHMHSFFGNTSTNAGTTTTSLLASTSSCDRGMGGVDLSAYWVPSLYKKNADGSFTHIKGNNVVSVYYRRPNGVDGPLVNPFPQGLRMLAGDPTATAPQPTTLVYWQCGAGGPIYVSIPTCGGALQSDGIRGDVKFPSCWDGRNLDSANHRSHMAYPASNGTCPADHPVSLPKINMEIWFPGNAGGPSYFLASDKSTTVGGYSLHADFFAAWDNRAQNALVSSCSNNPPTHLCQGIFLSNDHEQIYLPNYATGRNDLTINLANFSSASPYSGLVTPSITPPAPMPSPTPSPTNSQMDHGTMSTTARPTTSSPNTSTPTPSKTTDEVTVANPDVNNDTEKTVTPSAQALTDTKRTVSKAGWIILIGICAGIIVWFTRRIVMFKSGE